MVGFDVTGRTASGHPSCKKLSTAHMWCRFAGQVFELVHCASAQFFVPVNALVGLISFIVSSWFWCGCRQMNELVAAHLQSNGCPFDFRNCAVYWHST